MNKFDNNDYPLYSRIINYICSWIPKIKNNDNYENDCENNYNDNNENNKLNKIYSFENIDRLCDIENNISKNNCHKTLQNYNRNENEYRSLKL